MKGEINCIVFSSLINPLFRTLDHFALEVYMHANYGGIIGLNP